MATRRGGGGVWGERVWGGGGGCRFNASIVTYCSVTGDFLLEKVAGKKGGRWGGRKFQAEAYSTFFAFNLIHFLFIFCYQE